MQYGLYLQIIEEEQNESEKLRKENLNENERKKTDFHRFGGRRKNVQ